MALYMCHARYYETWNTCGFLCHVNVRDVHWKLRRQNMQCRVVICTRRCSQFAQHRVVIKHASGGNTRGEKTREGRKSKRGILSPLISFARVISRVRVLSRAGCSVVSSFSERHAYSRCTKDRRFFKLQITAHCKFNMKHHIKHTEDYHRRQS